MTHCLAVWVMIGFVAGLGTTLSMVAQELIGSIIRQQHLPSKLTYQITRYPGTMAPTH